MRQTNQQPWITAICFFLTGFYPTAGMAQADDVTNAPPLSDDVALEMVVETDVEVPVGALSLRANVFRPDPPGKYPVIMSMSSYGKDLGLADSEPEAWQALLDAVPDVCQESSCEWFVTETVDPERWVPDGYVVVRVDARGTGKSPGVLDAFSEQEIDDYVRAIEWTGTQDWSNGRVGLVGVSYYAMNQWLVAARQPEHLAAIIPWEGASDFYRGNSHHGGIPSNVYPDPWWEEQVLTVQHGNCASPFTDLDDGEPIGGQDCFTESELAANRVDLPDELRARPLNGAWYDARSPDLASIEVPVLSAGNWGGLGLHLRGSVGGYVGAGSEEKWLAMHTGDNVPAFYEQRALELQRQFFDFYLKGDDNGWDERPPLLLDIRHADGTVTEREEQGWPIPDTVWTRYSLHAADDSMSLSPPSQPGEASFDAASSEVVFTTAPFADETEITGPVAARLWVSSSTTDADLFLTLRAFNPDGNEVVFEGANDPAVPISQGWLRLSHRALNPELSTKWRPWHPHDAAESVKPGEAYEVEVEIWPTSVVLPAGYTLSLTVAGRDFMRSDGTGSGPFLHVDRPAPTYTGITTIFTGPTTPSSLLVPVVPAR
ncbi:MAG: CocE/NonD family hydrolase [Pseudohongiellaceae bacterium]